MKLKNLLMVCLLVISGSAAAQQLPDLTPAKGTFAYDTELYLYNAASKGFLIGANNWGTRTSISATEGYKVKVLQYAATGEEWDGKTVILKDYCVAKGGWKEVFLDADGNSYVDRGSQANYYWSLIDMGNGVYRFGPGAANPEFTPEAYPDVFLGHYADEARVNDADNFGTRLFWNCSADSADVDLYFVETAVYDCWLAKQSLRTAIYTLQEVGGDASEYIALYNNADATVDEVNAAISAINKKILEIRAAAATAENPVDLTVAITNPSYDNNNNTGWTGTNPGFQSYTDAEWFQVENGKTSQDLSDLPDGVYDLRLKAFYRAGSASDSYNHFTKGTTPANFQVYAVNGTDTATVAVCNIFKGATSMQESEDGGSYSQEGGLYVPNNMQCAEGYFKKGFYQNNLTFAAEGGQVQIGLTKGAKLGNDWCIWDQWELMYYGQGADAYALWIENVKSNAPEFNLEGVVYTESYLEAYEAKKAEEPAANKTAILTWRNELNALADSLQANLNAWKAYQTAVKDAQDLCNEGKYVGDEVDELAEYCDFDAADILSDAELTTGEVIEETAKVQAMVKYIVENCITPGADVTTRLLVNADFEQGATGWSGGPVMGGTSTNKCAEAYEKNFNVYQETDQAPKGLYEIEVQAFFRPAMNDVAWPQFVENGYKADVTSFVYLNQNTTPVMCLYDEWQNPLAHDKSVWDMTASPAPYSVEDPDGRLVPGTELVDSMWFVNDMKNTAIAFSNGMYKSSAFGIVAKKGDKLRIGIKRSVAEGNKPTGNWTIFDNFKLTFQGTDAEKMEVVLVKAIADAQAKLGNVMSNGTKAALEAAIAAGQDLLGSANGEAKFDAVVELNNQNDSADVSTANYAKLLAAGDKLREAIDESEAAASVKSEAMDLLDEIDMAYANTDKENAEIAAILARVDAIIVKLKLPDGYQNASDDNAVDMTGLLQTPGFEKDGVNSVEGWQGTDGKNFGNDDTQKSAFALEFYGKKFDMYQDVIGLPNGTYEVALNAFGRNGGGYDNYKKWVDEPYSIGTIYAQGESNSAVALPMIWTGMQLQEGEETHTGSQISDPDGNTLGYIPNSMVDFRYFVDNYPNCFRVALTTKVNEEKLRVGIKCDGSVSGENWIIMDDWTLTYYGTNSSKEVTPDDPSGISNLTATKGQNVVIFNLNGTRTNGLTKGVNIMKMTDAEGNTTVRKVIVK